MYPRTVHDCCQVLLVLAAAMSAGRPSSVIQPDQLMSFGCTDKCDFNWGEEVIEFFMAHPKP
jgi:hypothetical protein